MSDGRPQRDNRKCSNEILEQNRLEVIRLWKAKKKQAVIAEEIGVSIGMVCQTIKRYKNGGYNLGALKSKTRGRAFGEKRSLTLAQELSLLQKVIQETPADGTALWSREYLNSHLQEDMNVKPA